MNITFPTINTPYRSAVPAQTKRTPSASKARGDYDTVNISRTRTADDEETFARMLARRAAAQLNTAGQDRVQELKSMVADGTYTPDPQRIAGRMLGLG